MGQTLTHGIYLPDEGERNCYSGLAANWQILDNSVGTIAEHTSALAGKAPLVHTHSKSDITDFPAYGNTAGTICEGNDSRLSDARTPVAHTHTKSDVTDLLNSNFIPSANNSYDLGSSSYQWNNLYAKGYYYNGVAWGLDKDNTWTGANSFYKSIQFHGGRNAYIMPEFGASYSGLAFGTVEFKQSFKFGDWVDNNSTIGINPANAYVEIYAGLDSSDSVNKARITPVNTTVAELGTSINKWKSLNGINPGALSLPSSSYESINNKIYNPSDQLNAIDLNGGANYWISDCDCYIYFYTQNDKFSWIQIYWPTTSIRCGQTYTPVPNETTDYSGFIPVAANVKVMIKIKGTQVPNFRRVACQGNV